MSGWDRLCGTAADQEGYFTASQALAAGYTQELLEALIGRGEIEPCYSGEVYRLAEFVPSEHEDLVELWLQTDRQGILSHETALALHELSDLLPSKLHITVPPGWIPGKARLAAHVVLERGDISKSEISWLGALPVTTPLRTLRDCIAIGVSLDFIEQAIEEGLQRGLFTEAALPQLALAESA